VVVGIVDARDTVAEQDAALFGMVVERGRALVIAVNKWDNIPPDQRDSIRAGIDARFPFLEFAYLHFISARHGTGVGEMMGSIVAAYNAAMSELPTPELTRVMEAAIAQHQPPVVRGRRIKLRYAHQGGRNPPVIVIHGNQTEHLPEPYKRYLMNTFREAFKLKGTPVRIQLRSRKTLCRQAQHSHAAPGAKAQAAHPAGEEGQVARAHLREPHVFATWLS
jgi:GTP-binding protein